MKKLIFILMIIAAISCGNTKSEQNFSEGYAWSYFTDYSNIIDSTANDTIIPSIDLIADSLYITKNGWLYEASDLKYYSIIISDGKGNEVKVLSDSTMSFYFDKEHLEIQGDTTSVIIKLLQIYVNEKLNN